jgi:hypothetical protein
VRALADQHGLRVAPNMGDNDVDYLGYRLFSRVLAPAAHPLPNDHRGALLWRYLTRRVQQDGPRKQLIADVVTALGVSVLPGAARSELVRWRLAPRARPEWLQQLAVMLAGVVA